ncbi:hypothetical protein C8F01DRAFT_1284044 [Mycena amicta]|nr:hypothetical protein C8F01DRAFT_1284044 [Mycena amicta]
MAVLGFKIHCRDDASEPESSSSTAQTDSVAMLLPLLAILIFLLCFITVILLRRFKVHPSRRRSHRTSIHKRRPSLEALLQPGWEKHPAAVRTPALAHTADADNVAPGQEDDISRCCDLYDITSTPLSRCKIEAKLHVDIQIHSGALSGY